MVERLNYSFDVSDISHRARFVFEDFSWNYPEQTMCKDAKKLANDNSAKQLRSNNDADLVIMLTSQAYNGYKGCVAEIGPDYSQGYGIVNINYANPPSYVFTHEVGHLLGAQHEHFHPRHRFECNRAYEIHPNYFYSVMWADDSNGRIGYFSNPDVTYAGFPTGSNGTPDVNGDLAFFADNAGRVKATGCDIANFEGDRDIVVVIDGDDRMCSSTEIYTANVTPPMSGFPGQPPYTYEWKWNYGGIFDAQNPGTVIGSNSNTISIPPPNITQCCQFFFIRVRVTAADGTIGEAIKRINTTCEPCTYQDPSGPSGSRAVRVGDKQITNQFRIFPNPSVGNVTIEWNDEYSQQVIVKLIDTDGKILKMNAINSESRYNRFIFNRSSFPARGVYWINILNDSEIITKRIIIQ